MREIDYIVQDLIINKEGKIDIKNLYKTLKSWFDANKYILAEQDYKDILNTDSKDFSIHWESFKEVDDYTKFRIKVVLTGSNIRKSEEDMVEGSLKLLFEAYIESDYNQEWEGSPFSKFLRGLFDKFGKSSKRAKYEKELKEHVYDIYNKAKSFLGSEKFQ